MVIDNPDEFRLRVGQAQMEGIKYLIVTEKLFSYLTKNSPDLYMTYGVPGVKVYKEGMKDKADAIDSRTAEQAMNER